MRSEINMAIFASGTGSNAKRIIEYFNSGSQPKPAKVNLVVSNNPAAKVLEIAEAAHIPSLLVEKERFFRGDGYIDVLQEYNIRFLVLAGFLWKIPQKLIDAYPNSIINIHPALLPKYGGKGMYGHRVHQAVIDNHDKESGITIHYVDGHYDNGDVIFQSRCAVMDNDTAETLASRVQALEHQHYPAVIEKLVRQLPTH